MDQYKQTVHFQVGLFTEIGPLSCFVSRHVSTKKQKHKHYIHTCTHGHGVGDTWLYLVSIQPPLITLSFLIIYLSYYIYMYPLYFSYSVKTMWAFESIIHWNLP